MNKKTCRSGGARTLNPMIKSPNQSIVYVNIIFSNTRQKACFETVLLHGIFGCLYVIF